MRMLRFFSDTGRPGGSIVWRQHGDQLGDGFVADHVGEDTGEALRVGSLALPKARGAL